MTVCQGASTSVTCGDDSIIAVADIQYGTKPTTTCGLGNNSIGCCDYVVGDCMIAYVSETTQQERCSGNTVCSYGNGISAVDTSSCVGANYPISNHYLTMEYYCLLGKLQ